MKHYLISEEQLRDLQSLNATGIRQVVASVIDRGEVPEHVVDEMKPGCESISPCGDEWCCELDAGHAGKHAAPSLGYLGDAPEPWE